MMRYFILCVCIILIATFPSFSHSQTLSRKVKEIKCGVCIASVNFMEDEIFKASIDHNYEVQSRYRLDEKRSIQYSRSEQFIYSLLDGPLSKAVGGYGILNTEYLLQVMPQQFDPRVVVNDTNTKAIKVAFDNLMADFEEEFSTWLRRSTDRGSSLKFCEEVSKSCKKVPVEWGDVLDPYPEPPTPEPTPEAEGSQEGGPGDAGDNAATTTESTTTTNTEQGVNGSTDGGNSTDTKDEL